MICLYLIYFLLLLRYVSKKSTNKVYLPVLALYVIGALCAIYVHYVIEEKEISIISISYHIIILTLFLAPISTYSKREKKIVPVNIVKFKTVGYFFIIFGIFSLLFFIGPALKAFTGGDIYSIRNEMVKEGIVTVQTGLINTIAGTIANFYPLIILFFFYSIAFLNLPKWFNCLLILSSLSYIVHIFAYVGRDGILFWMFSFLFSYCLFEKYLDKAVKIKLRKFFFAVSLVGLLGFIIISIGRFMHRGSYGAIDPVTESLINYQGQVFNNFGQYFIKVEPDYHIRHLSTLFSPSSNTILESNADFYWKYGFNSNIFSGFVTALYSTFGPILSIVFSVIYAFLMCNKFSRNTVSFSDLIIFTLVYQIPFHCYYYFRLYMNVGTFYIISILILSIYFKRFKHE